MENAHPMVVHFPIALLVSAFLIETAALLLRRPGWRRISLALLGLGVLGAGGAVLTGRIAEGSVKHSPEIHEVMERHGQLATIVFFAALALLGWRLVTWRREGRGHPWLGWLWLGAICGLVALTAHLGGRLVYEFGVGGSYGRQAGIEVVR